MSKYVLITGATSGIGKATALELASKGHSVLATGRNKSALEELAKIPNIESAHLDVTLSESIEKLVVTANEFTNGDGIDVLINNAGFNQSGPIELVSDDDVRAQFETNFFGVLNITKAFIPQMRNKGEGRIINTSSMVGRVSIPLMGIYNASKHALEAVSDALRMELKPFKIDVVLIEPGMTKTALGDRTMEAMEPYRQPDSPYYSVMKNMEEFEAQAEKMYASAESVAEVITKTVEANRVRARYVPGVMNKFSVRMMRNTPTVVLDTVLRYATGLTEKKMSKA